VKISGALAWQMDFACHRVAIAASIIKNGRIKNIKTLAAKRDGVRQWRWKKKAARKSKKKVDDIKLKTAAENIEEGRNKANSVAKTSKSKSSSNHSAESIS